MAQTFANLFLFFLLSNSFNSFFPASGIFILIPVILLAASAASLVFLLSVALRLGFSLSVAANGLRLKEVAALEH